MHRDTLYFEKLHAQRKKAQVMSNALAMRLKILFLCPRPCWHIAQFYS